MGRPSLELGTAGQVRIYPQGSGFRARALYRDYDGKTRHVERTGKTRGAAQRALAAAIRDRTHAIDAQDIKAALPSRWSPSVVRRDHPSRAQPLQVAGVPRPAG